MADENGDTWLAFEKDLQNEEKERLTLALERFSQGLTRLRLLITKLSLSVVLLLSFEILKYLGLIGYEPAPPWIRVFVDAFKALR